MGGIIVRPRSRNPARPRLGLFQRDPENLRKPRGRSVVSIKDGRTSCWVSAFTTRSRRSWCGGFPAGGRIWTRTFSAGGSGRHSNTAPGPAAVPISLRLVWSESDGLPGVIADRYGKVVVLQTLTMAMDLRRELIAKVLAELTAADCVIERNECPGPHCGGMELRTGIPRRDTSGSTRRGRGGRSQIPGGPARRPQDRALSGPIGFLRSRRPLANGRRVLDCFSKPGWVCARVCQERGCLGHCGRVRH